MMFEPEPGWNVIFDFERDSMYCLICEEECEPEDSVPVRGELDSEEDYVLICNLCAEAMVAE
jgi:hypothetical protein